VIALLIGEVPQVVTWCQAYNNTQRLMKAKVDLSFNPSTEYHNYKILITPQNDDEVNVSLLKIEPVHDKCFKYLSSNATCVYCPKFSVSV
jgi:hypothetical protein